MSAKLINVYCGRIADYLRDEGPVDVRRLYKGTVFSDTVPQFDFWHQALCKLCSERKVIYDAKHEVYTLPRTG